MSEVVAEQDWLLESEEPWTRLRALIDLEGREPGDPEAAEAHRTLVEHVAIRDLIDRASKWPGHPLKRHNDASHPLYALSTLADFGLTAADPGIRQLAESVLDRFDGRQFETLLWLPRFLTKEDDREAWSWMLCDSPTLLYALLSYGFEDHPDVAMAAAALAGMVAGNGWRCGASNALGKFSGPGRKEDTCPMATIYSLKALRLTQFGNDPAVVGQGVEAILSHWEHQADYKLRMFGIGTDFRKLRYPFVWYDILHVADVLSRYPTAVRDERFDEIVSTIESQANDEGRYSASAMFRSWSSWSFANKSEPSPWLTLLVARIRHRVDLATTS